jgi:hypothetical protein
MSIMMNHLEENVWVVNSVLVLYYAAKVPRNFHFEWEGKGSPYPSGLTKVERFGFRSYEGICTQ